MNLSSGRLSVVCICLAGTLAATPGLVGGKPPAPRTATVTLRAPGGAGARDSGPGAVLTFGYDQITSRLSYRLTFNPPNDNRISAVWIHTGTADKPGAARHQLFAAGGPTAGTVTLSSADRKDLADGRLLARLYVKDGNGSVSDLPLAWPEATSLSGTPLYVPATLPNRQKLDADLEQALKTLASSPNDPESLIWVGRRYVQGLREA